MDYAQPSILTTPSTLAKDYKFDSALFSVYSAAFMVFCTVLGVVILAPMLPPFGQASASAETIAAFYTEANLQKKIGLCIMMFGTPFIIPLFALVGEIMKRRMVMPVLGSVQFAAGLFGILFTFMMTVCWGTAAFRPERSPEITQALHDLGWLFATWVASATLLQLGCICAAVFRDKSTNPIFPKWFGYFNMWMLVLGAPACVINIFHTGPFAYDGLLGFWVPYAGLFAWFVAMMLAVAGAVKRLNNAA